MDNQPQKKTVLIVEDDIYMVRAYVMKLEKEDGVKVESVSNGEEASEFIKKNKPVDLVILDLMLPKKSGFDVLKEMKENKLWKGVPVVILSNLGQQEDISRGKELGADDYIIKADININEVIKKIKKYL